jgi:hypothetical protein
MSDRATRITGLYAAIAAGAATLLSPLFALSYFATDDGAEELETGTVVAWAEPARDLAGALLTWASPDRVYATYLQGFALLFPALFLCARAVRARRPSAAGRLERWGWRIARVGYGLVSAGLIAAAFVAVKGSVAGAALNVVFLALIFPGFVISVIGSTVLGIALLRDRYTPKLTAWLLAMAFPSMLVVPTVLGHNSLGLMPLFLAWGATGLQLWRESRGGRATRRRKRLASAAAVLLVAFAFTFALSVAAIAGDDRRPQTDRVLADIVFTEFAETTERFCVGQDGRYFAGSGTARGTSTGDPRLSGDVTVTARTLVNIEMDLGTDIGRIVIRDPETGRKKAEGSFSNVSTDEISQGTIVGRVYDAGTGGEETTGAGTLVANWRVTSGETGVTAQIGATASDARLPALVQSGHCRDGDDDD